MNRIVYLSNLLWALRRFFRISKGGLNEVINHMKGMGMKVHTLREMEIFMQQHPELFDDAQMISTGRNSINNSLSLQEKNNIRSLLRTINRVGTTLLDDGDGTMYLLDHTDREGIETRNRRKQDGFNCRLKFSVDGYSEQEIDAIKK